MFTEEENKIISLFYSGDYELAEQLMIATNNVKLVDKLICKIHRILYKYKRKENDVFISERCRTQLTRITKNHKAAIALYCLNILIKGFCYAKYSYLGYESAENTYLNNNKMNVNSDELIYVSIYRIVNVNEKELEKKLKLLGVRLTIV